MVMPTEEIAKKSNKISHEPKRVKPDRDLHLKELDVINSKIEKLKIRQADLKDSLRDPKNVETRKTLDALFEHLKTLKIKRDEVIEARTLVGLYIPVNKIIDKIKLINNGIKKKIEDNKLSRDKIGYKSGQEIDREISNLEQSVSSGKLTLAQEKKVVSDISALQKSKRSLELLNSDKNSSESDQKMIDELKLKVKALDTDRDVIQEQMKGVNENINSLKESKSDAFSFVNDAKKELSETYEIIRIEYAKLEQLRSEFKLRSDEYYQALNVEFERKKELQRVYREEQEQTKMLREAQNALEKADIEPFVDEINICTALLLFFEQSYGLGTKEEAPKAAPKVNQNIRIVDSDLKNFVPISKKDDDYMVLGKKSVKKVTNSVKAKNIRFDLDVMTQLTKLGISIPSSIDDIIKAVENLKAKKDYFIQNQAHQTLINQKLAQDKFASLKIKPTEVTNELN